MIKIVKNPENQVKSIDNAQEDLYYGIVSGYKKGFICRDKYNKGDFKCYTVCFNRGDQWPQNNRNLQNCLTNLIDRGFDVFEFETHIELFQWLIK